MQFNFSALKNLPKGIPPTLMAVILTIGVLASALVGTFTESGSLTALTFFGSIGLCIAIFVPSTFYAAQRREQALKQFSTENGFTFAARQATQEVGTLFSHGGGGTESNIIEGTISGLPFKLFEYTYSTGSGKSRRTYYLTSLALHLPRKLPHMVIDSLVEPGANGSSVLPIDFDASQRIELEGNFNRYFNLYAPDTYGISALTIIAPDVMMTLMQHAALCDIEIIDDKLYFYWPKTAYEATDFEKIFATVEAVLKEVQHKLTQSDIYATDAQESLHTQPNTQKGVHLKKRGQKWAIAIIIVLLSFYVCVEFFPSEQLTAVATNNIVGIGFWIFMIGIFATAFWKEKRRKYKLRELEDRYKTAPHPR